MEVIDKIKNLSYQAVVMKDCLKMKAQRSWKLLENTLRFWMIAQLFLCISGQLVFADASSASALIGNLVSIMASIFKYVGMALIAWGIFQFLLAVKKQDAESKSDAVTTAVVGIALMFAVKLIEALDLGLTVDNTKLDS